MRLLITGASGNLGSVLSRLADQHLETWATWYSNRHVGGGIPVQLDLRDADACLTLVHRVRPDVIIHAATSDTSHDMATTIILAARNLAEASAASGARLVTFSTDLVFDGKNPPYDEDAPPSPLKPYAQAKVEADRIVQACVANCLTIRTSLIYDFVSTNRQLSWMLSRIQHGEKVPLFTDEVRQPIWVHNLAQCVIELAATGLTGVLNVAGPQALTRYEYGCRLLEAAGISPADVVVPALAGNAQPERAPDTRLNMSRATRFMSTPLLTLTESLDAFRRVYGHPASTTTSR
ncbi:MAG: SDR family oxidoreductase [Anaerolineae bacterium]|nr:SDR family oxidoreductase [Anaerolineae bacterium]